MELRRFVLLAIKGGIAAFKAFDLMWRRKESRAQPRGARMDGDEPRRIFFAGQSAAEGKDNVADAIAAIVDPIGGIELDLPPRTPQVVATATR